MEERFIKHSAFAICLALYLLLVAPVCAFASDAEWIKVRSKNFLFIGNADEREMRAVAAHLEAFRASFLRLLTPEHFDDSTPTIVVIFRDEESYAPFKPLYRERPAPDVVGYFQPGMDVNHITFVAGQGAGRSTLQIAAHEYAHLLIKNAFRHTPLWFKEGIAEYYGAFQLDGVRSFTFGSPLKGRIFTLRNNPPLPLETLLTVEPDSPYYIESKKHAVFYAESWALVHYLLNSATRRTQLTLYLQMLAGDIPERDAFQQAFQTDVSTIERELREYVRRNRYIEQRVTLENKVRFNPEIESAPVTEAESQIYLGDLLLRAERFDAAEGYLQRAAKLDPNLARAHVSLGILRLRQQRSDEAKVFFLRAIAADERNHLAHYFYADALARDGSDTDESVKGYAERTNLLRNELRRAIQLAPNFLEAYRLLAEVELGRGMQLDAALELLGHARRLAPARPDFVLLLARVRLRKEEYAAARTILDELKQMRLTTRLRDEAQTLIETIAKRESLAARHKAREDNTLSEFAWRPVALPCDLPQPGPYLKKLRFEGEQACGKLVKIECYGDDVLLSIDTGERTLKLHAGALNRVRFVTYTIESRGVLTCGEQKSAVPVLVTYRAFKETQAKADGEAIAVEFVPPDWKH